MERTKKQKKKRHILLFFILICGLILVMPKYDSFAWFTTQSFADGQITNAGTSDLLSIDVGEVKYLKNCNVQTSVSITNISNVDIPIQLELLDSKHSKTKVLSPGESLVSGKKSTDSSSCEATQITYHLLGFQGYINENIVIPLSADQMIKPVKEKEKEDKEEKVEEEKANEIKEESEVNKEKEPNPPEEDPPINEEAPTEPTPQPEETPETTDEENNQADTPAPQTENPAATEDDEDVQKDA